MGTTTVQVLLAPDVQDTETAMTTQLSNGSIALHFLQALEPPLDPKTLEV